MDMVVEFEGSMQVYRKQIEELENHLNLTERTSSLTAQGLFINMAEAMLEIVLRYPATLLHKN